MSGIYSYSGYETWLHRLDPRTKLVFTISYLVLAFLLPSPVLIAGVPVPTSIIMCAAIVAVIWAIARISPKQYAIFLVYLVMASQFESLLHPFVILFTIPLAMVGAVAALLLTRSPASVVVFIGLILLVGLVVKNAIILIDKVNQLREAGVAKRQALVEGARSRLRPIMMTTLTAVFGFLPLALAFGEGAEVRSPMAITVIGGLVVSTLLTLVVIPVVYDLLDRKPDEFYAERGRRARKDAEAVAEVLSHEHDPLNGAKA